jgi:chemotaxis protein MotB
MGGKQMFKISSFRWAVILLAAVMFTGCVSSSKYNESLAKIDNLEGNVKSLHDNVKSLEGENTDLKSRIAGLSGDLAKVTDHRDALEMERDGLLRKIADLEHSMEAGKLELTTEVTNVKEQLLKKTLEADELQVTIAAKDEQIATIIEERDHLEVELNKLYEQKRQAELAKQKAVEELKGTYEELVTELKSELKEGEVTIMQLQNKLSLSMVDKILFDSGSAEVKSAGKKVLNRVAEILMKVDDKQIMVVGHTDNQRIGPRLRKKFPTNWELSSQRATNVVKYLQEAGNIDPKVLTVAANSMYQPIASNETKEGMAKNRRIEIVLVPLDIEKAVEEAKEEAEEAVKEETAEEAGEGAEDKD